MKKEYVVNIKANKDNTISIVCVSGVITIKTLLDLKNALLHSLYGTNDIDFNIFSIWCEKNFIRLL